MGLGVANITLEYLENLNRFTFTEDKTEIKNRMVKQFQASQSGISQDKLDAPLGVRGRNSNNDIVRKELGWDYSQTLEEGIAKTYDWIVGQINAKA